VSNTTYAIIGDQIQYNILIQSNETQLSLIVSNQSSYPLTAKIQQIV